MVTTLNMEFASLRENIATCRGLPPEGKQGRKPFTSDDSFGFEAQEKPAIDDKHKPEREINHLGTKPVSSSHSRETRRPKKSAKGEREHEETPVISHSFCAIAHKVPSGPYMPACTCRAKE